MQNKLNMQKVKKIFNFYVNIVKKIMSINNKNNNIFRKNFFLGNNSSEFVETLYADYLNNPSSYLKNGKSFLRDLMTKKKKF